MGETLCERIVRFIGYDVFSKEDGKWGSDDTGSDEEFSSKSSRSSDDTDSDEETSSKSSSSSDDTDSDETGDAFAYVLIFLQLVEGVELAKHLRQNTELSKLDQLVIFSDILEGVSDIHSKDIVHCDLKPQNIMVWSDSSSGKIEIKIFDFGISCDLSRTYNEILAGTAGYASFEQEQDEPAVSFASDVHALGWIFLDLCGFDMRNRTGDSENWRFFDSATMEVLVRKMRRMAPKERPKLDQVIKIVRSQIRERKHKIDRSKAEAPKDTNRGREGEGVRPRRPKNATSI